MKAAVLEGPERISVREIPTPKPDKGEVLVKVRQCGICAGDLTMYKFGVGEGRVFGHEFSGDIVELGEYVKDWSIGDRVVIEPTLMCGECYWCKRQQYNMCNSWGVTGIDRNGGFAEYVTVPEFQLYRLPDEVSYEEGALVEPIAVALRGVNMAQLKPDSKVAVFGCGSLGLLVVLWAKALGAECVIGTVRSESKIAIAKKHADVIINPVEEDLGGRISELTNGIGPDIIFECTGNPASEAQALDVIRKGGQIIVLGNSLAPASMMLMTLSMKEVTLKGSLAYNSVFGEGEFSTSINFLKSKKLDVSSVVTSKIYLDDISDKGFSTKVKGEGMKILVTP